MHVTISYANAYLLFALLVKAALAVDGLLALVTYHQRMPTLDPLPHADTSVWCFCLHNAIDMIAHLHRPLGYSMLHHCLSMAGGVAAINAGGFSPSIIRMSLVLEAVGPWYKALTLAKRLQANPRVIMILSAGVVASNTLIRLPYSLWLACTLLRHMHKYWDYTPMHTLRLWGLLVAYCPLLVYLDLKWSDRVLQFVKVLRIDFRRPFVA